MAPELYVIKYANRAEELLRELNRFVSYVTSGPVVTLLPIELRTLSARDHADVSAWESRIERAMMETVPLNASSLFWLSEIEQVFKVANQRLDELEHSRPHA
jgi:hypothetical protein